MKSLAALIMLLISCHSNAECLNTGEIKVFKTDGGFWGFELRGEHSFRSLFLGSSFNKAEAADGKPLANFAFTIDKVHLEWLTVNYHEFNADTYKTEKEKLQAHYLYEINFILNASKASGNTPPTIENFGAFDSELASGGKRTFQIWKAVFLKNNLPNAAQYWVTTTNSDHVVVLAVILPDLKLESVSKPIIDNYMYNFGPVSKEQCDALAK